MNNDEFLDLVEDFLEKGAELNKFTYDSSENGKIHLFKIGRERLVLVKHLMNEHAILNDQIGILPIGFIGHVLNTLKPEYLDEK